ncbi:DUF3192 domain-containing protein [Thalassotalea aquiviva]|uniref:DUF3192 domain-containing protein n=1 Tax=Thalassotalea aquiviva TaxID=3242415 RepID=UPI00352A6341
MKKSLAALLIAAPLAMVLPGCIVVADGDGSHENITASFQDREYENRKKIARLSLDMGYLEVQDHLGVPDFNETFQRNNENIQVLFYRTNRKHKDSMTTKDECTPLVFKNGKLVSWGEKAYKMI